MIYCGQEIVAHSLVDGWTRYVSSIFNNGTMGVDDDQPIREQFGVTIFFTPEADFEVVHPAMDMVLQAQYVKKMFSRKKIIIEETIQELGSSYAVRIFEKPYGNQFDAAVGQISKRPESKSVIINLLHPLDWERKTQPSIKRMACLTCIQPLLREGQLHFFAHFRSQNAWNSHGNFKGLYELQRLMLSNLKEKGLNVNRGGLRITVTAAHLYEPNFKAVERLLKT
jgi:thymidylate synthase